MVGAAEGGASQPARQLLQSRRPLLAGGARCERGTGAAGWGDRSEGRVRSPSPERLGSSGEWGGGKPTRVDSEGRAFRVGAVVVCAAAVVVLVADGEREPCLPH